MMKIDEYVSNKPVSAFLSRSVAATTTCILLLFISLFMPVKSYAFQIPWAAACAEEIWGNKTINGHCMPAEFPALSPHGFTPGQEYDSVLNYQVSDPNTVPVESDYRSVLFSCEMTSTINACTKERSKGFYLTGTLHLIPNIPLSQQNTNFGAVTLWRGYTFQSSVQVCIAIKDEVNNIYYADNSLPNPCSDLNPLEPAVPSTCSLNSSQGLTVAFNEIDRSDISTTPASQTSGNVEKTIPVTCTGETAFTVKTKFTFTPITVSNNQVVASSNPNLGVAIIYNGKVVSPTDVFDETYQLGTNNINLEFQVVHDSSVATKDIATGDFSASAVMVMTQQ
ncbi:MAG: fimbrial protein [Erwinia billingiae]